MMVTPTFAKTRLSLDSIPYDQHQELERAGSPNLTLTNFAKRRMLGLRKRSSTLRSAASTDYMDDIPGRSSLSALNESSEATFLYRSPPLQTPPQILEPVPRSSNSTLPSNYANTPMNSRPQSRTGSAPPQTLQRSPSFWSPDSPRPSSLERGVPIPDSPLIPQIDAGPGTLNFYASSSDEEDEGNRVSRSSYGSSQTSYDMPTPLDMNKHRVYTLGSVDESKKDFFSFDRSAAPRSVTMQPHPSGNVRRQHPLPRHFSESSSVSSVSRSSSTHTASTSVTTISSTGSASLSSIYGEILRDTAKSFNTPTVPMRSPRRAPSRNFSRPTLSDLNVPLRRSTGPVNTTAAFAKYSMEFNRTNNIGGFSSPLRESFSPVSEEIVERKEATISSNDAASVLLLIMSKVNDFTDLLSLACSNKGFYGVFKGNKLALVKAVLRNKSPPAWELREASPKEIITNSRSGSSKLDYTPTKYVQFHTRDTYTILQLRTVIFVRCQALLRPDTAAAIRERSGDMSRRIDSALWRIWTFCTLFGSGKGREGDIMGQMDWLNGGTLARPTTRGSEMSFLESPRKNILPTFGRGNPGGLSADDLCDMTEMWICIKALLANIKDAARVSQARAYGVFHGHKGTTGNPRAEELLIEWVYHLGTLGLSAVLDLAVPSSSESASVFVVAKSMGWTRWSMPSNGLSRATFLDDPLSRVYEQRMAVIRGEIENGQPILAPKRQSDRPDSLTFGPWMQWMNEAHPPSSRPQLSRRPSQEKPSLRSRLSIEAFRKTMESPRKSMDGNGKLPLSLFPPEYKHSTVPPVPAIPSALSAVPARLFSPPPPPPPPPVENSRSPSRSASRPPSRSMFRAPSRNIMRPSACRAKTSPAAFSPPFSKPVNARPELPRHLSSQQEGRPSTSSSIGFALSSIMDRGFSRDEARSVFHRSGAGMRADVSRAIASLFDRKSKKAAH